MRRSRRRDRGALNQARRGGYVCKVLARGRALDDVVARGVARRLADAVNEWLEQEVCWHGAEVKVVLRRHGGNENLYEPGGGDGQTTE
jgi:hypothetical protein